MEGKAGLNGAWGVTLSIVGFLILLSGGVSGGSISFHMMFIGAGLCIIGSGHVVAASVYRSTHYLKNEMALMHGYQEERFPKPYPATYPEGSWRFNGKSYKSEIEALEARGKALAARQLDVQVNN
jgi:hypothetical protein